MGDRDALRQYSHLPVPTYEEATSRPSSSTALGPREISDDAERQGLLGEDDARPRRYKPPTIESPRDSEESDLGLPEVTGDGDGNAGRGLEELDYLEPGDDENRGNRSLYNRARIRSKFSQRWSNISATFLSLRLPRFRRLYRSVPDGDAGEPRPTPAPVNSTDPWLGRIWMKIPPKYRLSASTAARLCGLLSIAIVVYILFAMEMIPNRMHRGLRYTPESVRSFVQGQADANRIRVWLDHITSFDHVAGTKGDYVLGKWMEEQWAEQGGLDQLAMLEYSVYLNYPRSDGSGRKVEIVQPEGKRWTAHLEENQVYDAKVQTHAWHGHSRSGSAQGHLIYANGGSREDFQWLRDQGVVTNGSIALVRYYATQGDRALKIKAAEEAGCVGVLIYSDPVDDGVRKGVVWPDGPWRPADSLQRGGVSLMSWVVGDPLTPGWASKDDAKRLSKDNNPGLNNIPSLPLAWRDAEVLLKSLVNVGVTVPMPWIGGSSFQPPHPWYSGQAPSETTKDVPIVSIENELDEIEKQPIWNVHGLIEGFESPNQKVLVGNHRDSWCFGSVDPGSGSAIMMEVVSIFSQLRGQGWRPLRTIEFASWDAEEYNLVGSTEYVEDNEDYLRDHAVAYINVDVGVSGPDFRAAGSPQWQPALMHVLDRVADPSANGTKTVKQSWEENHGKLEGLGAGSDYVAFQDIAGTSSIDFGFEGPSHGYPYHSCYESFEWMERFGDPNFERHRALAQVWSLLILEIADRPLIPFDLVQYGKALESYVEALSRDARDVFAKSLDRPDVDAQQLKDRTGFDTEPLLKAAQLVTKNAEKFHRFEDIWSSQVLGGGGLESTQFGLKRLEYNRRIGEFETDLLDIPRNWDGGGKKRDYGVPGREQFKHVVFGPQSWSGYDEAYFPAVRDAVDTMNWKGAQTQLEKAATLIERAAKNLIGGGFG